jgi:hypothetical protein
VPVRSSAHHCKHFNRYLALLAAGLVSLQRAVRHRAAKVAQVDRAASLHRHWRLSLAWAGWVAAALPAALWADGAVKSGGQGTGPGCLAAVLGSARAHRCGRLLRDAWRGWIAGAARCAGAGSSALTVEGVGDCRAYRCAVCWGDPGAVRKQT